jgi:hypothetical protein
MTSAPSRIARSVFATRVSSVTSDRLTTRKSDRTSRRFALVHRPRSRSTSANGSFRGRAWSLPQATSRSSAAPCRHAKISRGPSATSEGGLELHASSAYRGGVTDEDSPSLKVRRVRRGPALRAFGRTFRTLRLSAHLHARATVVNGASGLATRLGPGPRRWHFADRHRGRRHDAGRALGARIADRRGRSGTPGFIDAHIHLIAGGFRLRSAITRCDEPREAFVADSRTRRARPDGCGSRAATGITSGAASCRRAPGSTT